MHRLFGTKLRFTRTAAATALVVLVTAAAGVLPGSAGAARAAPRWAGPTRAASCGVGRDGKLWCTNARGRAPPGQTVYRPAIQRYRRITSYDHKLVHVLV